MWKKIALALAAVLAVLAAVVTLRSPTFRVERATRIAAPAHAVYERLADFRRWAEWSPWAHVDPSMKQAFLGAPAGAGAEYTWSGNVQIGEGRMAILEARPDEHLAMTMDVLGPIRSSSRIAFQLAPDGDGVRVVWKLDGTYGFGGKAVSLVASMEEMLGRDFEEGLAKLKAVSETGAQAAR
jgi:uncharacterized protein YndB with AHSA1/START domain